MQQTPVKYGIIAGVASAVLQFAFYKYNPELVFNLLAAGFCIFVIPVVGIIAAVRNERTENGGKIDKMQALKTGFLTWIFSMVIIHVFIYFMFNHIAPELPSVQKKMLEAAGDPEAAKMVTNMPAGKLFFRMIFMFIPGFLFSYMVASFLKK